MDHNVNESMNHESMDHKHIMEHELMNPQYDRNQCSMCNRGWNKAFYEMDF